MAVVAIDIGVVRVSRVKRIEEIDPDVSTLSNAIKII